MLAALALSWPFLMFRGAIGIVFGVIVLAWPGLEPTDVALLFGAYAFSDGVLATVVALSARDVRGFVNLFIEAVIRATVGLIIVAAPALAAPRLLDIVTAWMLLSGISAFLIAVPLRRELSGEWPLPFAGAASLILGAMLRLVPPPAWAIGWILGPYSVLSGFTILALALRLRQLSFEIAGH